MSTSVIYNGVEIRKCLTKRFDQECVYDDSGTDKLYDKFTIRVAGVIHRIYLSDNPTVGVSRTTEASTGGAMSPNGVATNEFLARRLLMEPRRPFRMTVSDATLLACDPRLVEVEGDVGSSNGDVSIGDVNNGPKPKHCNITHIVGTETMTIEFEIEICKVECESPNNYSGVLNNRWSMADQIDGDWYTTRTITGRLRVADVALNPQAFRNLAFPPLQNGFKRESIETTTSLDGLTLDYKVVDKEIYASCPAPGTTWEGTHTISSGDGSQTHAEINLWMAGSKDADKADMILAMATICQVKLNLLNLGNFVVQVAIVDHMNSNRVEMKVLVDQTAAIPNPLALFNLPAGSFGKLIELPGYDRDVSRAPAAFGTATVTGLFVSYLQSPCSWKHNMPQTTDAAEEPEAGDERSENPKTYTYEGELPTDTEIANNYNVEAAQGVYTFYEIETTHDSDHNTVVLPIAKSVGEGSGNPESPTCAFVRLAPETLRRRVRVTAIRLGRQPLLPAARSVTLGSQRIQILRARPIFKAPQITADGKTRRYESAMVLDYALSRPALAGESFLIGKIPWDTSTVQENAVNGEVFSQELIT
jgi:hypothetical protein